MNENKRRQILKRATLGCLLVIACAFFYVIFQGLLWSPKLNKEEAYQGFSIGETRLIRHKSQRYWVTKLSDQQRKALSELAKFVHIKSDCTPTSVICELDAKSQRSGVLVQHVLQKPAQLPSENLWFGGFVDPATKGVYDLLGRGYLSNPSVAIKSLSAKPN